MAKLVIILFLIFPSICFSNEKGYQIAVEANLRDKGFKNNTANLTMVLKDKYGPSPTILAPSSHDRYVDIGNPAVSATSLTVKFLSSLNCFSLVASISPPSTSLSLKRKGLTNS